MEMLGDKIEDVIYSYKTFTEEHERINSLVLDAKLQLNKLGEKYVSVNLEQDRVTLYNGGKYPAELYPGYTSLDNLECQWFQL